jgi:hypothetical protein
LLKNDLPPVVIKSTDKKNYLSSLHNADAGDLNAFVKYIAEQLVWSLELSIEAAKGESVEEPDDLEKEISLMEKEIEVISGENIKNNESMLFIWNSCLFPLFEKYFKKFSAIEKLFKKKQIQISYQIGNKGISSTIQQMNEWFNSDNKGRENVSWINIYYDFVGMKKLHFNIRSYVRIDFQPSRYSVSIDNKRIEKRYNQFISGEEMENLVNERAEDFLKRIKIEVDKANS